MPVLRRKHHDFFLEIASVYTSAKDYRKQIYSGAFYCVWILIRMKNMLFVISYFYNYVVQMNCHHLRGICEIFPKYKWINNMLGLEYKRVFTINLYFIQYRITFLLRIVNNCPNKAKNKIIIISYYR